MNINVITSVSHTNLSYYPYLKDNLLERASPEAKFSFTVVHSGTRDGKTRLNKEQREFLYENADLVLNADHIHHTHRHTGGLMLALQACMPKAKPDDYTLITDIDVAIVMKNFDVFLEKLFTQNNLGAFGQSFFNWEKEMNSVLRGPHVAHKPGDCHLHSVRYHNAPTIVWMIFKNGAADWTKLDLRAEKNVCQMCGPHAKIFSLPEDVYLHRDAGWRIPLFLHDYHVKYDILRNSHPFHENKDGFVLSQKHQFYEEGLYNDQPFLAHQGLAQRFKFRSKGLSQDFYEQVDAYIQNNK